MMTRALACAATGVNLGALVVGEGLAEVVKHRMEEVRTARRRRAAGGGGAVDAACGCVYVLSRRSGRPRTTRWWRPRLRPPRVCVCFVCVCVSVFVRVSV